MKLNTFSIRQEKYKTSGSTCFRVTGMLKGKQVRKFFPTLAEANAEKIRLDCEAANVAPQAIIATTLTPEQAKEAVEAFAELKPGARMLTAVRFFNDNWKPSMNPTPLKEAYDKFQTDKARQGLRAETVRNLKSRIGAFTRWMPEGKLVSEVMPDQIKEFIHRDTGSKRNYRTIKNDWLALSCFFNWCVLEKCCAASPMLSVPKIKVNSTRPVIFTNEECRKLMASARQYQGGRHVPYFALALFCGLRPGECMRMKWANIDLAEKEVRIDPDMTKTRQDRFVKIHDNAAEWLLPHALKRTKFNMASRHLKAIKTAAGLQDSPQDVMRHTAISNYQAKHQHEGLTAEWAGNSVAIVKRHYKKAVKQKDADEFWAITPASVEAKILELKAA